LTTRHETPPTDMIPNRAMEHKAPLVVTSLVLTSGMAFSFFWLHLTQTGFYHQFWLTPGDIWTSYRTAHWVGWGAYGSLYSATNGYLTFPGLAILLAPLAMLTRVLGLTECLPLMIPHPTAWLLLGPVEILLGCTSLFALDELAARFGVQATRRWIVCLVQGFLLWPLLVTWGHPEDAVALGLTVYALINVFDRRWTRAGWLLGAAVAFQPLVLLVLPLCLGRAGRRDALHLLSRSLGPSIALLVVPFLSNWHDTWRAVVEQPTQIAFAHVTPWTTIAPHVAAGVVSCGPTRTVAILGAVLLGWYTAHRRSDDLTLVFCAALCLGLRFVSESALEGYYIWPALALFVFIASCGPRSELIFTSLLAVGLTIATARHFGPWWFWWGAAVLGLVLAAASSRPGRETSRPSVHRGPGEGDAARTDIGFGELAGRPIPRILEPLS
jgi:hypothetical protein